MRDDFNSKVKTNLAKRAGYKCSNPNCRKITIGANSNPNKSTNIGVAAHITAASKKGPRFNENISSTERKSIENGIWLCQTCSVLIDRDEKKYTKEILKEWKFNIENETIEALEGKIDEKTKYENLKINTLYHLNSRFYLVFTLMQIQKLTD